MKQSGVIMERAERIAGDVGVGREESLAKALEGWEAEMWGALPGAIVSINFSSAANGAHQPFTCDVQPMIKGRKRNQDGTFSPWTAMPLIPDVPIQFPGGGGWSLTFPLAPGDEGLLIFCSRCIDYWHLLGAGADGRGQPQAEFRMHDLSDAIFIPKLWSRPKIIPNVSAAAAQLRSDDGLTYVELAPGGLARIQAADVQVHARTHYSWDVNGYGFGVTYAGGNVWNVHAWQTPRPGDVVNSTTTNINPPEGGS
jgi:hypothetical protein